MSGIRVRRTLRADLPIVAGVWVEAFTADPYLRWIAPGEDTWAAFGPAWMSFIAGLAFERGHTYVADPPDAAVAWIPPDLSLVGPDDVARGRAIIAAHAGDKRAEQAVAGIMAARAHALEAPHWTLQYIGVRPARAGAGLGAAMVAPVLAECDADGLACALVSTNPRNLTFYERLGFRVDAEVPTPEAGAVLRPMHRTPGAGAR